MIDIIAPYRSMTAADAVEVALREANRLGMRLYPEQIGSAGYPITRSRLVHDATQLAVGYGKGPGPQGVASAHFEALERYLMSAPDNRRSVTGAASLLPAYQVAGQAELRGDLVVRRWAMEFPASVAACVRHQGTRSNPWYPVFLTDPRYFRRPLSGDTLATYRSLLRYASSLGTAAGVDRTEAVFHGLCELIEHDGLSHALLRWFMLWWRRSVIAVTGVAIVVVALHDVLFGWVTRCGAGLPLAFVLAFLGALAYERTKAWIVCGARAKERAKLLGGSLDVKVARGRAGAVAQLPVLG